MLRLPAIDDALFPRNERRAIRAFWVRYWAAFFALLPFLVVRQVVLASWQALGALWTWNRRVALVPGELDVVHMATLRSLALTALFGERFTALRYRDVLVDPGPPFGRERLRAYLERLDRPIAAVVATHEHEEHVGNAAFAARWTGAPVHGSETTLRAVGSPPSLSPPRRAFIGQPTPASGLELRPLTTHLSTPRTRLEVVASPGHSRGHVSLFDRSTGILFAGDSFMHVLFSSPNADVSTDAWIETLEGYAAYDVRTMIGTHGAVETRDPAFPRVAFVTSRADPAALLADKARFLRWSRDVVREGERRGLPYPVIEACLFPWSRRWSWGNWFADESARLFSAGEFSRTRFVRSLSASPNRVGPRFGSFVRAAGRVRAAVRRALRGEPARSPPRTSRHGG